MTFSRLFTRAVSPLLAAVCSLLIVGATVPSPAAALDDVFEPTDNPAADANQARAAENVEKDKTRRPEPKLVKGGVLSVTGSSSTRSSGVSTTSDPDIQGGSLPPVAGSVSKVGQNWKLVVTNNSKDRYSVSLRVVQLGKGGRNIKSDSVSYTLQPGQREERLISGTLGSEGAQVVLENFKRTELKPKEKPSASPTP